MDLRPQGVFHQIRTPKLSKKKRLGRGQGERLAGPVELERRTSKWMRKDSRGYKFKEKGLTIEQWICDALILSCQVADEVALPSPPWDHTSTRGFVLGETLAPSVRQRIHPTVASPIQVLAKGPREVCSGEEN